MISAKLFASPRAIGFGNVRLAPVFTMRASGALEGGDKDVCSMNEVYRYVFCSVSVTAKEKRRDRR
jgi:hypothetical protein